MYNIQMSSSWLFLNVKWKKHNSILTFCIDICPIANNLLNNVKTFIWSIIRKHMFIVNNMTCWNNFDINEF